jgi:transcriptional regulator with XRE-family HTH domain
MYLSQSKLSLLAGLGRITVHNIEERRTQGNVGIVTVERLARVLRLSPAWLAFGLETPQEKLEAGETLTVTNKYPYVRCIDDT